MYSGSNYLSNDAMFSVQNKRKIWDLHSTLRLLNPTRLRRECGLSANPSWWCGRVTRNSNTELVSGTLNDRETYFVKIIWDNAFLFCLFWREIHQQSSFQINIAAILCNGNFKSGTLKFGHDMFEKWTWNVCRFCLCWKNRNTSTKTVQIQ